jgi:drug/metabolite transporter (DMT)-like permease
LLAAFVYGAADFCGGLATRRTPMIAVALISQAVGFVLLLVALPFTPGHAVASDYIFGALAGVCGALAITLLYHALSIGKMGIVSPITAVLAAAFPLVFGTIRGDRLTMLQILGLVLALIAIVLISFSFEDSGKREIATAGVREAIVTGFLFGGFFILLSYTHPAAGLHNLLGARVTSIALLLGAAFATRTSLVPVRADWPLIVACGVLDMTANILYVVATFVGTFEIAAVLTSLYPASTVFLARVFLGERLGWIQKAGVAIALAGVLLISFRQV